MVRDNSELYVTVPSLFRCPISMDVMKSPVSLCTGVTYDRSSIQKWLESGHNTCPATMQVLQSTDVIPNLTLRRLIRVWSDSALLSPSPSKHMSHLFTVSKHQVIDSVKNIADNKTEHYITSLTKINEFARYSEENREFLASVADFVPALIRVINVDEIEVVELIISILDFVKSEAGIKRNLQKLILNLSPFVLILQRGDLSSRIKSARILESIAIDSESQRKITEKQGLLYEIYRLISSENNQASLDAGLSALISLVTSRPSKKDLIRFGIVKTASKILSSSETSNQVIEKVLMILETVSTCTEGRSAIGSDESCVSLIVQKLLKISVKATEHGITVLWSVCYMSRDHVAQEAVIKSNGVTKVLLVMQSNCSASVRQMCGDLVKVFRVNSKSCLASYETRTTHIMPY